MSNQFRCLLLIAILNNLCSCSTDTTRSINSDGNLKAVGNIRDDSTFDGLIKFYDIKSGNLVRQNEYTNGILNGKQTDFYKDGKVANQFFYEYGKQNGYGTTYNEDGIITSKSFFFYDIRTADNIEYTNGIISDYWFYSLDGKSLLYLDYADLKTKRITDIQSAFFFYHDQQYNQLNSDTLSKLNFEFFLYTPRPPNYNFRYSLIRTDNQYKEQSVIQTFDTTKPWSIFTLSERGVTDTLKSNIALKLSVYDSIAGGDIVMYKKLRYD